MFFFPFEVLFLSNIIHGKSIWEYSKVIIGKQRSKQI